MKSISKLKDKARLHEQKEEWEQAIQLYTQAIRAGQADDEEVDLGLFNRIGDLYLRLNRPGEAVRYYEEAADRYAEAGLYNNAIALCNKALRHQPDRVDLLRRLSRLSAEQGFLTDARRWCLEYAERMRARGALDEAFQALEEFADLSDEAEIRELLGHQLGMHGRTIQAVEQLRRAYEQRMKAGEVEKAKALEAEIRRLGNGAVLTEPLSGAEEPETVAPEPLDTLPLLDSWGPAKPEAGSVDASSVDALPLLETWAVEPSEDARGGHRDGGVLGPGGAGDLAPSESAEADPLPLLDTGTGLGLDGRSAPEKADGLGPVEPFPLLDVDLGLNPTAQAGAAPQGPAVGPEAHEPFPFLDPGREERPPLDAGVEALGTPDGLMDTGASGLGAADPLLPGDLGPGFGTAPAADGITGREFHDTDAAGPLPLLGTDLGSGPAQPAEGKTENLAPRTGAPEPIGPIELGLESGRAPELAGIGPAGAGEPETGDPLLLLDGLGSARQTATRRPNQPPPPFLVTALEQARERLARGQRAEAQAELERLHAALAEAGRLEEALAVIEELSHLDPDQLWVHQRHVEYAFKLGRQDRLATAYLRLAACLQRRGATSKAAAAYERVLELDPGNEEARAALFGPVQRVTAPPQAGYVDLGSWLRERESEETTRFKVADKPPSGDEARDFAEMLNQFKAKIAEHLSVEDSASHFDLGLAFKEMGLLDEAIAEFQIALRGGGDRLKILEEVGQCFMRKKQYNIAINVLSRALELPCGEDVEQVGIYYHLGRCHEELGHREEAREAYERVLGLDIRFRDAAERIGRL